MEGMLTCSLCFDIFTKPRTFPCFHSFCSSCIDKLPTESHHAESGYLCPLCRSYASQEDVKSNFLISELLHMYNDSTEKRVTCLQCVEAAESQWKCVDCKIELCEKCHMSHLRIPVCRGHRVIPLDSETELVIDRLVFCKTHDDQPIMLNCKECELPLCIKCKVTEHESHKTETVERAVERLKPSLLKNREAIGDRLQQLNEELEQTSQVVQETKEIFSHCRDSIESQRQILIAQINQEHQQKLAALQTKETVEMAKLDMKHTQIENKIQEYRMLQEWIATTVEKTRGAILLVECQGGLQDKVERLVTQKTTTKVLTIEQPTYLPNNETTKTKSLLGRIEYNKVTVSSVLPELPTVVEADEENKHNKAIKQNPKSSPHSSSSSSYPQQGKTISVSLTNYLAKKWSPKLEIKIAEGHCAKITCIGQELWLPIFNHNCILVYSQTGEMLKKLSPNQIKGPIAIEQSDDNLNLLVASESGIHVINCQGDVLVRLKKGMFSDICVQNKQQMAALEYGPDNHCQVIMFKENPTSYWELQTSIPMDVHSIDKFSALLMCGEIIYICPSNSHRVYVYKDGSLVIEYGSQGKGTNPGQLYFPMLCSSDKDGHILVADCHNRQLQLLHADGHWEVFSLGSKTDTLEAVALVNDKTMWVLQNWNKLVKYGCIELE